MVLWGELLSNHWHLTWFNHKLRGPLIRDWTLNNRPKVQPASTAEHPWCLFVGDLQCGKSHHFPLIPLQFSSALWSFPNASNSWVKLATCGFLPGFTIQISTVSIPRFCMPSRPGSASRWRPTATRRLRRSERSGGRWRRSWRRTWLLDNLGGVLVMMNGYSYRMLQAMVISWQDEKWDPHVQVIWVICVKWK